MKAWLLVGCSALVACGSGPDPSAFKNRTFYEYGSLGGDAAAAAQFEKPYPPLDLSGASPLPDYSGVAVLEGTVRLSRPKSWVIRAASLEPERRFIQYVSTKQVMFSVYERIESPEDPWRVILGRYEDEVKKSGGALLGGPVPASTWNAQARIYDVERSVAAPKAPFVNRCREYLARSEKRLVLIQIVHQGDSLEHVDDELLRVVKTLQVL